MSAVPFPHAAISVAQDRLTELGAAERFVQRHGDDVRFDHRRHVWLLWSEHRWARDADGSIFRLAAMFARDWQREAVEIGDTDKRAAHLRFAMKLERRDALASMLALASNLKPIADAGTDWDADPMLLGVTNGVVDLKTGVLRDGRRDDRITMTTGIAYDADATCHRWEQVLAEVFNGADDLVEFMYRAVGYSLTGDTGEQCLFLLCGNGSNGKSTLLLVLKFVLGDYLFNMPFSTVELHQRSSIPNDLAALVGRRFVMASETNDGTRLNEGRIKALTGSDTVTARFLHSEFFEFEPVAKFWLAVNHKPIVRDDSHGFWRRLRLVPFTQTFALNPRLVDELRAEAPGILAWAVRGCLAWQQDGLKAPDAVVTATRTYAEESDPLAAFLEEGCELEPAAEVVASELFDAYRKWATDHGLGDRERLTATAFGRKMSERFPKVKRGTTSRYQGLARR